MSRLVLHPELGSVDHRSRRTDLTPKNRDGVNLCSRDQIGSGRLHSADGRICQLVCGIMMALAAAHGFALETDQYYAWGRTLPDSTEVVNAKFNLELKIAATEVNTWRRRDASSCEDVVRQFHSQVHFTTFQEIEIWALKSDMLSRVPADPDEELEYRQQNLYRDHGLFDPASWLPIAPTIQVNGVRCGTDKLAHFVSSGYRWYEDYAESITDGLSAEEAEQHVIEVGLFWERTMLGGVASGATSLGDLEANRQGMLFYYGLCHGPEPTLMNQDGLWVVKRAFDIRRHVSPEWDESYHPPIYSDYRWSKVLPVLETYCDRLSLPSVQQQRAYYRSIDCTTAIERVVAKLVESGELADPQQFTIEANCPPVEEAADPPREAVRPPKTEPATDFPDADLMQELYRRDTEVHQRTIGLAAAVLTNPERLAGSIGVLFTRVPEWWDCTTVCSFQGPMVQLSAGVGGGRLSAGWARVIGDQKAGAFLVTDPYLGLGFKGTFLYTWGNPYREPTNSAFFGGEVEFTIARVNLRAGAFYNVGGAVSRKPWLLSGGIGWGF